MARSLWPRLFEVEPECAPMLKFTHLRGNILLTTKGKDWGEQLWFENTNGRYQVASSLHAELVCLGFDQTDCVTASFSDAE